MIFLKIIMWVLILFFSVPVLRLLVHVYYRFTAMRYFPKAYKKREIIADHKELGTLSGYNLKLWKYLNDGTLWGPKSYQERFYKKKFPGYSVVTETMRYECAKAFSGPWGRNAYDNGLPEILGLKTGKRTKLFTIGNKKTPVLKFVNKGGGGFADNNTYISKVKTVKGLQLKVFYVQGAWRPYYRFSVLFNLFGLHIYFALGANTYEYDNKEASDFRDVLFFKISKKKVL